MALEFFPIISSRGLPNARCKLLCAGDGWRLGCGLAASTTLDTYATILLMAHISPAYVQKQLGHHSISMTVDIYGHWVPGEGGKRLAQALRPKAKPGNHFMLMQGRE